MCLPGIVSKSISKISRIIFLRSFYWEIQNILKNFSGYSSNYIKVFSSKDSPRNTLDITHPEYSRKSSKDSSRDSSDKSHRDFFLRGFFEACPRLPPEIPHANVARGFTTEVRDFSRNFFREITPRNNSKIIS